MRVRLSQASEVVCKIPSVLSLPADAFLVCEHACSDRGTVVSTPTHEHNAQLRNPFFGRENVLNGFRNHFQAALRTRSQGCGRVRIAEFFKKIGRAREDR